MQITINEIVFSLFIMAPVGALIMICWLLDHYEAWHILRSTSKTDGKLPKQTGRHRR